MSSQSSGATSKVGESAEGEEDSGDLDLGGLLRQAWNCEDNLDPYGAESSGSLGYNHGKSLKLSKEEEDRAVEQLLANIKRDHEAKNLPPPTAPATTSAAENGSLAVELDGLSELARQPSLAPLGGEGEGTTSAKIEVEMDDFPRSPGTSQCVAPIPSPYDDCPNRNRRSRSYMDTPCSSGILDTASASSNVAASPSAANTACDSSSVSMTSPLSVDVSLSAGYQDQQQISTFRNTDNYCYTTDPMDCYPLSQQRPATNTDMYGGMHCYQGMSGPTMPMYNTNPPTIARYPSSLMTVGGPDRLLMAQYGSSPMFPATSPTVPAQFFPNSAHSTYAYPTHHQFSTIPVFHSSSQLRPPSDYSPMDNNGSGMASMLAPLRSMSQQQSSVFHSPSESNSGFEDSAAESSRLSAFHPYRECQQRQGGQQNATPTHGGLSGCNGNNELFLPTIRYSMDKPISRADPSDSASGRSSLLEALLEPQAQRAFMTPTSSACQSYHPSPVPSQYSSHSQLTPRTHHMPYSPASYSESLLNFGGIGASPGDDIAFSPPRIGGPPSPTPAGCQQMPAPENRRQPTAGNGRRRTNGSPARSESLSNQTPLTHFTTEKFRPGPAELAKLRRKNLVSVTLKTFLATAPDDVITLDDGGHSVDERPKPPLRKAKRRNIPSRCDPDFKNYIESITNPPPPPPPPAQPSKPILVRNSQHKKPSILLRSPAPVVQNSAITLADTLRQRAMLQRSLTQRPRPLNNPVGVARTPISSLSLSTSSASASTSPSTSSSFPAPITPAVKTIVGIAHNQEANGTPEISRYSIASNQSTPKTTHSQVTSSTPALRAAIRGPPPTMVRHHTVMPLPRPPYESRPLTPTTPSLSPLSVSTPVNLPAPLPCPSPTPPVLSVDEVIRNISRSIIEDNNNKGAKAGKKLLRLPHPQKEGGVHVVEQKRLPFPDMSDYTAHNRGSTQRPHLCEQTRIIIGRVLDYNREVAARMGHWASISPWAQPDNLTACMVGLTVGTVRLCETTFSEAFVRCTDRGIITPSWAENREEVRRRLSTVFAEEGAEMQVDQLEDDLAKFSPRTRKRAAQRKRTLCGRNTRLEAVARRGSMRARGAGTARVNKGQRGASPRLADEIEVRRSIRVLEKSTMADEATPPAPEPLHLGLQKRTNTGPTIRALVKRLVATVCKKEEGEAICRETVVDERVPDGERSPETVVEERVPGVERRPEIVVDERVSDGERSLESAADQRLSDGESCVKKETVAEAVARILQQERERYRNAAPVVTHSISTTPRKPRRRRIISYSSSIEDDSAFKHDVAKKGTESPREGAEPDDVVVRKEAELRDVALEMEAESATMGEVKPKYIANVLKDADEMSMMSDDSSCSTSRKRRSADASIAMGIEDIVKTRRRHKTTTNEPGREEEKTKDAKIVLRGGKVVGKK